ncbi:MAG: P-II family nitrogen regulator [Candidatus Hydrogenedentes bacterium]|nr:P-II family nitrogen regulator [Candidatus Hydrogenedentota bacterium]
MKLVAAYIQPFMAEKVADALRVAKVHGVTVLKCQGFGRITEDKTPHYMEDAAALGFAAKTKIEIVCRNADTEGIIATIRAHAHTGHHGDGKIFVSDIGEAIDIRTDERGENVI